ncbi:MAG: Xaa-Pro peptidase family protein [Chloroflexota bacterium]|nr:Xaa-Pro peptidase family protein [Chloroflexota bacterium]
MKSDLDRLMAERNLDAFLVMGDASGNGVMNYLSGGAHLERALIVKRRNGPLTLIHGSMERDTAVRTGMTLVDRDQTYNRYQILEKHVGDKLAAEVDYLSQVVRDQGLQGRLGIYGMQDAGAAFLLLNQLQSALANLGAKTELVGEFGDSLFTAARQTKDDQEIAELQEAARLTCVVMGETRDFIQEHNVRDGVVMRGDNQPLTIGDVKTFIRARLTLYNMHEDHECIFSQGRDAGVPHNAGNPNAPLRLGEPIIFDFFPVRPSGYFHDVTRTWCLGYAPAPVQAAWDECKEIFDRVMGELTLGKSCRDLQVMTCEYFESKGHQTPLNHPGTHDGYVHGLGHGIGLNIHEEPSLSHAAGNDTVLQAGHVFSVEPGLYYAERGFGVRIEDSVAFTEAGELINLTAFPYDLVVPM